MNVLQRCFSPGSVRAVGATCLVAVLFPGAGLDAQSHGRLLGTVADEITAQALEGVTIRLLGPRIAVTSDDDGIFELSSVPTGEHTARIELPGYTTLVEQVEVLPDEVGLYQFQLSPVAVTLEGLIVRAQGESNQGAAIRQVQGDARFRVTALDLLREKVPGLVIHGSIGADTGIRIRGSRSLVANDPVIYVDGALISDVGEITATNALEQIPAERVARIRVLSGPAAAVRYGDASSGVILVETR